MIALSSAQPPLDGTKSTVGVFSSVCNSAVCVSSSHVVSSGPSETRGTDSSCITIPAHGSDLKRKCTFDDSQRALARPGPTDPPPDVLIMSSIPCSSTIMGVDDVSVGLGDLVQGRTVHIDHLQSPNVVAPSPSRRGCGAG